MMNQYNKFKYPHLVNVKNAYQKDDFYKDVILVTKQEKLDGTQGSIFNIDNKIIFASRNVLLLENDNAGFKKFCSKGIYYEKLLKYFEDNPRSILTGEWMEFEKKFHIFDEGILETIDNNIIQVRKNFVERYKILKNKYNLDIIEPFIIYESDSEDLSVEQIKELIRDENNFSTTSLEGFVFKIYTKNNDETIQKDILKTLNEKYYKISITKTKQEKKIFEFPVEVIEFLKENPNVIEKSIDKALLNNETLIDRKTFVRKNMKKIVDNILEEYKEYEKDTRCESTVSNKTLLSCFFKIINESY